MIVMNPEVASKQLYMVKIQLSGKVDLAISISTSIVYMKKSTSVSYVCIMNFSYCTDKARLYIPLPYNFTASNYYFCNCIALSNYAPNEVAKYVVSDVQEI